MRAALTWTIILWLSLGMVRAADPQRDSDSWLTNGGIFPEKFANVAVRTNLFANLRAEVVAGTLQVKCELGETISELRLVASADAPGHWPARDWRTFAMRRFGASWGAEIPVDSLDVPQIYFVAAREREKFIASPMRMVHPRASGMEAPSHFFWAFIEGFEQDRDGWRMADGTETRTDPAAKSGRASLGVRVPAGQRSIAVETTRLRGWFLEEHGAAGVGVWLRTKSGAGTAAFTLVANARSTNQIISRRAETVRVSTKWTKAALLFESFPKVWLGDLDLFSIEFAAEPGTELLIDDLHLLGRWWDDF
ncbi:MAG TPA: hypothetical protein VGF13_13120 [Verrucomicrobiae bacterium]|jgi:hypothetical protein